MEQMKLFDLHYGDEDGVEEELHIRDLAIKAILSCVKGGYNAVPCIFHCLMSFLDTEVLVGFVIEEGLADDKNEEEYRELEDYYESI